MKTTFPVTSKSKRSTAAKARKTNHHNGAVRSPASAVDVVVAVDLDRELAQRLERFAARERLSTDEILSRAILESLGQWESGAKNAELIDLGRALLNSGERVFGKKRRARMKEIAERDGITMDELAERACNAYFGQDKFVTSREPTPRTIKDAARRGVRGEHR